MDSSTFFDGAFHQTQAMARTMGLNLTAAMARGHLGAETSPRMMAACHRCSFSEVCTVWLSECREACTKAPEFCANKPILDRLALLTG